MSTINKVAANTDVYDSKTAGAQNTKNNSVENNKDNTESSKGAVYEQSDKTNDKATYSVNKMSAGDRAALVQKLKADEEARRSQMTTLVEQMISKQTNAYGQANNIWKFLAGGNFTVDAATQAQAKADIGENGYYGVQKTAERMFDFASALAGDNPEKMKEMQAAFEKGFKQAEKTWGGKLPSISYETKDKMTQMFDNYYASKKTAETGETA